MTTTDAFAQGEPAWIDLQSPDQEASKRFYSAVFGWEYQDNRTSQEYVYSLATVRGSAVAGIAPQAPEAVEAGISTYWTTYFACDDVDAVQENVAPAGGRVIFAADDVEGFGRMALVEDSIGAPFALWQAGSMTGAGLINEPGAFVWHELAAGNWEHAVPFYRDVFGVEPVEQQMDDGTFTMIRAGDQYVAGFRDQEEEGSTPHWEVYFSVADTDATVAAATGAGAELLVDAYEIEGIGRMAMLRDPHGAVFWVMQEA
ncbi:VOC family protein [Arthrobacter castelli]|uniref:VOC family protein n=1 Tax=Arthrobacter castelli TaxID=271431 RepID=UPI0004105558|nr:VOC family protein [Arthrobacter castelli]